MGEGIISGILGDEDEKPEVETPESVGGGGGIRRSYRLTLILANLESAACEHSVSF